MSYRRKSSYLLSGRLRSNFTPLLVSSYIMLSFRRYLNLSVTLSTSPAPHVSPSHHPTTQNPPTSTSPYLYVPLHPSCHSPLFASSRILQLPQQRALSPNSTIQNPFCAQIRYFHLPNSAIPKSTAPTCL